jgi:hypothetical protein
VTRLSFSGLQQILRERAVLVLLTPLLWVAIYLRVDEGYGSGSAVIAATCTVWGYVILSLYATHLLNGRFAGSDSPGGQGPRAPGGRWPGARP